MLWKGRRQSTNVEDMRGSGSRKIGFKGGIIGTLVIALIIYLLGGDPLQVLNMADVGTQTSSEEVIVSDHEKELTEFIKVVLADTEDVWNRIFGDMGYQYREPTLVLFRGEVGSACGYAESATGPFYCSSDDKIYIDLLYLEELQKRLGAEGDFAIAYILAHEVGHHVQNLLGIMKEVNKVRSSSNNESEVNELTVRLELQADFLAGLWVHHGQKMKNFLEEGDLEEALNAAVAVGDDRIQMRTRGYVVPDSFTHGTSEQRRNWLKKGIQTGDISQGDTFKQQTL